eukprot:1160137-Pelagomonas_calceolata.AAC.2
MRLAAAFEFLWHSECSKASAVGPTTGTFPRGPCVVSGTLVVTHVGLLLLVCVSCEVMPNKVQAAVYVPPGSSVPSVLAALPPQ